LTSIEFLTTLPVLKKESVTKRLATESYLTITKKEVIDFLLSLPEDTCCFINVRHEHSDFCFPISRVFVDEVVLNDGNRTNVVVFEAD